MRRGFKSQAERLAVDIRGRHGCGDTQTAPLDVVAKELGATIVPADELVDRGRLEELEVLQEGAFSAATFRLPNGTRVIVYNPLHGLGRTRSNQAHELAHILLDHDLRTIERVGSLNFFTCDIEQEEEADWLAGCLLLPRPLLLKSAVSGLTPAQIAEKYDTSEPMARFRLNASGVLVQVGRAKAAKARRGARK
ncbi:MAG TPA: ImmA/IrrE family metallo-endopeptidase [Acidimicrobiales bacterium]|nr:ImmA/IrrE family metallo-endopeptidase [Acidimicrobiales bacterium]